MNELAVNYTYEEPKENSSLLPAGEYRFEIAEVYAWEDSKAGNAMIPLMLRIDGGEHGIGIAYENLVFVETAKFKIDQLLKSIFGGSIEPGQKVDFKNPQWLKGRKGMVKVKPAPVPGKDYQKNEVVAFTYPTTSLDPESKTLSSPPAPSAPPEKEVEEDDIPF